MHFKNSVILKGVVAAALAFVGRALVALALFPEDPSWWYDEQPLLLLPLELLLLCFPLFQEVQVQAWSYL